MKRKKEDSNKRCHLYFLENEKGWGRTREPFQFVELLMVLVLDYHLPWILSGAVVLADASGQKNYWYSGDAFLIITDSGFNQP